MNPVNATALSGLQSSQARLSASAHNVANVQTPGFRRDEVQAEANPQGGVNTRVDKAAEPGVSLEQEVVEQMAAVIAYKANLQVVKASDRMAGALLNERA